MSIFGTAYIICGFLYLAGCVMDGQDLKPLWKKYVGNRLEELSNYFYPIEYVTRTVELPQKPIELEYRTFRSKRISETFCVGESDIMYYSRRTNGDYEMAKRMAVEESKMRCVEAVKNIVGRFVSIKVNDNPAWCEVYVEGSVYIGEE